MHSIFYLIPDSCFQFSNTFVFRSFRDDPIGIQAYSYAGLFLLIGFSYSYFLLICKTFPFCVNLHCFFLLISFFLTIFTC